MEPTTGKRKRSGASRLLAHLLAPLFGVLALIYLANPTFGLFELLPDNLPVVGNLDEAGAVLLLTNVLAWYGFNTGARGSNLGQAGRAGNARLLPRLLLPLAGALALLYLANPTLGFFELLPDNLPLVGNLDEGAAVLLLTNVLAWYGHDLNRLGKYLRNYRCA